MEPKPLLFPFLYDVQEAAELMTESTSIYDVPVLRERLKEVDQVDASQSTEIPKQPQGNMRSIALKNRKLIQGIVLRNEFAKLLVETKNGPLWIAKSQIVQIYD